MISQQLIVAEAEKVHAETKARVQSLKKVALSEAWIILQLVVASIVQIIETIATDLSGSQKKAIAIEYVNNFYDSVFTIIDIPLVPNLIEPIIHKYIKSILMILISSSIDATVTIFRQTGVFLKKGTI